MWLGQMGECKGSSQGRGGPVGVSGTGEHHEWGKEKLLELNLKNKLSNGSSLMVCTHEILRKNNILAN